jgi:hypothetical protein
MSTNRKRKELNFDDTMRNPIRAIDRIAQRIRQKNIGYQAALRGYVAHIYGAGKKVGENYELYQEVVAHEFSDGRKRLLEATEENFQKYALEASLRRAFHNSGVSESCISKYYAIVNHLSELEIPADKAEATIKSLGGIEEAYQVAKESKKETSATKPKSSTEGRSATKSSNRIISKYLHVTMHLKTLKKYLKGEEGDEKLVMLRCEGRDEAGDLVWALVDDDSYSPNPSNDDDDYGDIEEAA